MASLAVIVGLLFLTVLISGPLCFILSKIKIIPNLIINILSILVILIGVWWFCLPIGPIRYVGILTALLGYYSIRSKVEGA
jgi:hypothetical protein